MRSMATASLTDEERRVIERLIELAREQLDLRSVWLYGSRARGERPRPDSDIDLLFVAPGERWANLGLLIRLVDRAAEAEGANPMRFSTQVFEPDWIAGRRDIDSFFMREVDRDKIVLHGEP